MKEVNQAIYDEIFKLSQTLGFNTFNYLPEDTGYPFVYVGEQFGNPTQVKSNVASIGSSIITVHLYGEKDNRRLITDMMQQLLTKVKMLRKADVYSISFAKENIQVISDNSISPMLWHGILELEINYMN